MIIKRFFNSLLIQNWQIKHFHQRAINVYRKCLWEIFWHHNILNFASPIRMQIHFTYEQPSVHEACEFGQVKYVLKIKNIRRKMILLKCFYYKLSIPPFYRSIEQRNILQTRGEKALSEYYSSYAATNFQPSSNQKQNYLFADEDINIQRGFIGRVD